MPTVFAGLMCHAPIVIPAVAGDEAARCARTTRAMREVARRAVHARPDRLVLISPHSPRKKSGFGVWTGRHRGSLAAFRAPGVVIDLPDAPDVAQALALEAIGPGHDLDHGAVVPLAFLVEAGWRGPTAILALPWDGRGHDELGRRLGALPGRTAVIASGDMSHALTPDAPNGFHPDGPRFDAAFVDALRGLDWDGAVRIPREHAAEDVVESSRIAMAAAGAPVNAEVLAYEGPFGVGYTEAVFRDPEPPLWAVARAAIRAHLEGDRYEPPPGGPSAAPVFVTLRQRTGELRGCIGTLVATTGRRYAEVAAVAPDAATQDPRFPPVTLDELDALQIEVSSLDPATPADPAELDPKRFGVIATYQGQRGLLLPDLDGVDTVAKQLDIVRKKAGIPKGAPMTLQKFTVTKEESP